MLSTFCFMLFHNMILYSIKFYINYYINLVQVYFTSNQNCQLNLCSKRILSKPFECKVLLHISIGHSF